MPSRASVLALALAGAGLFGIACLGPGGAFAQEAEEVEQPADTPPKPAPKRPARPAPKPAPKPAAKAPEKAPEPPAEKPVAAAPPAQTQAAVPDVAAKLKQNGAGACAAQLNAIASETMDSVGPFNTASQWPNGAADKRVVAVTIGQKYPEGSVIPYAATSVVAAPNPQGSCDAFAFQILPSPLPCAKLRESLAANGQQIGDLVGLPLMQDARGQTLLIPAAANTCVLVGIKTAYAK